MNTFHPARGCLESGERRRDHRLGQQGHAARLGDEQAGGRPPEVQFLGYADEVPQLPELHVGIMTTRFGAGQVGPGDHVTAGRPSPAGVTVAFSKEHH
jgi:hypothetical protein